MLNSLDNTTYTIFGTVMRLNIYGTLFLALLSLSACTQALNNKGESEASQLSSRADECLYDVRDKNIGYTQSNNCRMLSGISSTLFNLGAPDSWSQKAQIEFYQAQRSAWIAVALNNYKAALGAPFTLTDSIW